MQQPSEIAILSLGPLQNRDFVSKIAIFRALREFCAQVIVKVLELHMRDSRVTLQILALE